MFLEKIKGNLGFGCMRLPMIDNEVDKEEFCKMADKFIESGFNYFDTAHGYIDGKSETAIRDCVVKRHKREDFLLADKISYWSLKSEEDVLKIFNDQLECCGVDYFDFYLFHCMNHEAYEIHKKCNSFATIKKLKEEGKIKHIGMSFHDTPEFLDMLLCEHPYMEFVQLQLNYLDYDDPSIQSKACYDVAVKHGKKVIVMEPVKGGALVDLPKEAKDSLKALGEGSEASYALRYAYSYPEVFMVLSGMGNMDMVNDNINTFNNFVPLSDEDYKVYDKTREILRRVKQIPCTKCNYCKDVCAVNVPVSEIFNVYNKMIAAKETRVKTREDLKAYIGKMEECIKCGKCENTCPQSIKIRDELEKINKFATR